MKNTALLVGINAKFIHSNLALRYIKKYTENYLAQQATFDEDYRLTLMEFSINQQSDYILDMIMEEKPSIVAFSCYLWNIELIRNLSDSIKKIHPDCYIVYGGPEVSYTAQEELEINPHVDMVLMGEGEESFAKFYQRFLSCKGSDLLDFSDICGVVYRQESEIRARSGCIGMNMDDLVFPYEEDLSDLDHRILYYETSRGCPFNCQYCLSSIEKGVRFKSMDKVRRELDFFLNHRVRQVKFVDRTFNAKESHALSIMEYVIEKDNGYTNFHFEVAPERVTPAFIETLGRAREGLFQLEIGVQSSNEETLRLIRRRNDLDKIRKITAQLKGLGNTHLHLDLIAGLPKEDYETFGHSFDYVYSLKPHQLQLGFLKVLKGSGMMEQAEDFGILYRKQAPYEVLKTRDLSFEELGRLKFVEEMVELFYNSTQFNKTIQFLEQQDPRPFTLFERLGDYWKAEGMHHTNHHKLELYDFLYRYGTTHLKEQDLIEQHRRNLMLDYCLNEKPKKQSDWMDYQFIEGAKMRRILEVIEEAGIWEEDAKVLTTKQRSRQYHMDRITKEMAEALAEDAGHITFSADEEEDKVCYMVVNYSNRDFITNNGEVVIIEGR